MRAGLRANAMLLYAIIARLGLPTFYAFFLKSYYNTFFNGYKNPIRPKVAATHKFESSLSCHFSLILIYNIF